MIDKSKIPVDAFVVLETLKQNGYECYLVGGCVRDLCLGKEPKDFDICTNATPDIVLDIFEPTHKTIPTGLQHGTITLIADDFYCVGATGIPIEVTTFRSDGDYSDNRKPDCVQFGVGVEEDISRRDFTINGILYDGEKVIDLFKGLNDLKSKIIKTTGNPLDRFYEDSLRMMRCVRFSCQLGFEIDLNTFISIKSCSILITKISQERIRDELCKILLSDRPSEGIKLLNESGILQYILPELQQCVGFDQHNKYHRKNVFDHILKVLESTPPVLNLRLAALFHDISKPETFTIDEEGNGHFYSHHKVGADKTREIMKRLKFDNETIDNVCILVYEHMSRYPKLREGSVKKLLRRLGEHNVDDLINLQIADIIGSKPPFDFENVVLLKNELKRIIETKEPISVKQLAINGHDLMKEYNLKSGKIIGEILKILLDHVLEFPENNKRDILFEIVDNFLMDKQLN